VTALIKGETSCNREACQADFAPFKERGQGRWWNTSTRKWYCRHCALQINRACVGYREPAICFEEGFPEFAELPEEDKP
jgi:hypothetical protein